MGPFLARTFCVLAFVSHAPAGERREIDSYGDALPPGALRRIGTIRFRHSADIRSLAYSPDGKHITSAADNAFAVWEAHTGRRLALFSIPRYAVAAVSPDGSLVAYSHGRDPVRICEARTGKLRCTLPTQDGPVSALAFSKDGSVLASTEYERHAFVWDTNTGTLRQKWALPNGSERCHLAFTGDGKTLVHAGELGSIISWNDENGRELRRIEPRKEKFGQYGLAVSDDGELVATLCSTGQRIDLWRLRTGEFVRDIATGGASGLTFSPDGRQLLWNARGQVCFWDLTKDFVSRRIPASAGYPCRLAFSPDGTTLAIGGSDRILHLWNLDTRKERFPAEPGLEHFAQVRFLADGKTLLSSAGSHCYLRDLHGKNMRRLLIPGIEGANGYYPDGNRWIYDISPEGSTIAVWNLKQRLLRLYDAAGKHLFDVANIEGRVDNLQFSRDGKYALVRTSDPFNGSPVSSNQRLQVWKRTTPGSLEKVTNIQLGWRMYWAPNSQWVAELSDGGWRFHEVETGKLVRQYPRAFLEISGASPSGRVTVMTPPRAKNPELWELATGKRISTLECERERMDFYRFVFSPDGRTVAVGHASGAILLWNALTGKPIGKLEGHHGGIRSLEFSPDGRLLLSAGADTTIMLWDCARIIPAAKPRTDLTPDIFHTLWHDLKADDAERGYGAVSLLVSAGPHGVAYLRTKLTPDAEPGLHAMRAWIGELDHGDFKVRSQATGELAKFGELAVPLLQETRKRPVSLECKRRVSALLEQIAAQPAKAEWLQTLRALEALEMINTPDARHLISQLANGSGESAQTVEARRIESRWKIRK